MAARGSRSINVVQNKLPMNWKTLALADLMAGGTADVDEGFVEGLAGLRIADNGVTPV